MKKQTDSLSKQQDGGADRALAELFSHAKPRPAPPAADAAEIRRAVHAEWDAVTGRRVWLRRAAAVAASAAALAIVFWTTVGVNPPPPLPVVATIERVQGTVGLRVGGELARGSTIATGAGRVALRLAGGGSLRLGPGTEIELVAADAADLKSGLIYFDSDGERAAQPFTLTTTFGTVRDVGTQFLTRVSADRLEVGVRDGRVALTSGSSEDAAGVGDKLVVTSAAAGIGRDTISTYGEDWAWAERLAPPFDIDGRTLVDVLGWFERQTGRTVTFGNAEAERIARETVLNGSIDLEPLEKLAAVLALTDLEYSLEDDRVLIAIE